MKSEKIRSKKERIMGFGVTSIWKSVVELNKFKTSYDYDKEDTIRWIAKERYGKSEKK